MNLHVPPSSGSNVYSSPSAGVMSTRDIESKSLESSTDNDIKVSCNLGTNFIKSSIKICHVNAQSLAANFLEFSTLFASQMYDVIAVSESWLKLHHNGKLFSLKGYILVRNDRLNKRGGGIAVYIRSCFKVKLISHSPSAYKKEQSEYMLLGLTFKNIKLLLCALYKPPKASYPSEFLHDVSVLLPSFENVMLIGDFNINVDCNSSAKKRLLCDTSDLGLTLLDIKDTHHFDGGVSTIDLCFVKDTSMICNFGKLAVPGLSNHDMIYAFFNVPKSRMPQSYSEFRDYKNIDTVALLDEASRVSWHNVMACDSINGMVDMLNKLILSLFDKYAPLKRVRISRPKAPFINREIKLKIKARNKMSALRRRFRHIPLYHKMFRSLRNSVKVLCKKAHNKFMFDAFTKEQNQGKLWQLLKNLGVGKSKSDDRLSNFNLNDLNSSFVLLNPPQFNIAAHNNLPVVPFSDLNFYFKHIEPKFILDVLKQLKSNAVGPDGISLHMIKILIPCILPTLVDVFNYSLQHATYPDIWKKANVIALPKISNPLLLTDYRPISILCVFAKMLEKIVYADICKYLELSVHNDPFQSGFKPAHNTTTALLKVTEDIRRASHEGLVTVLCLLDFSKAFDSVLHFKLLAALSKFNISQSVINWFKIFLAGRMQRVMGKLNEFSEWLCIAAGVPQGATLAPFLFRLYVWSLGTVLKFCNYHMYADDLQIYIHCHPSEINTAISHMNGDISALVDSCTDLGLKLNPSKSKVLIFAKPSIKKLLFESPINNVIIQNTTINFSTFEKNLGVIIDDNLSWSHFISSIGQKMYLTLRSLYSHRAYTPFDTRVNLVSALLFPILDYCDVVCSNLSSGNLQRLQVLQNNCVRYIFNVSRREHISPYYSQLKWLQVKERRMYHTLVLVHKVLYTKSPLYLYNLFTLMSDVHSRTTRSHPLYLLVPRCPHDSFSFVATSLWNRLPPSVMSITSGPVFKDVVYNLILDGKL